MFDLVLFLTLLFTPFTLSTPKYHIGVMHMGNPVSLDQVDRAWEIAGGEGVPVFAFVTTVILAPMAAQGEDCLRSVEWGVSQASERGGWMVVVNPSVVEEIRAVYLSRAFQLIIKNKPPNWQPGGCLD